MDCAGQSCLISIGHQMMQDVPMTSDVSEGAYEKALCHFYDRKNGHMISFVRGIIKI